MCAIMQKPQCFPYAILAYGKAYTRFTDYVPRAMVRNAAVQKAIHRHAENQARYYFLLTHALPSPRAHATNKNLIVFQFNQDNSFPYIKAISKLGFIRFWNYRLALISFSFLSRFPVSFLLLKKIDYSSAAQGHLRLMYRRHRASIDLLAAQHAFERLSIHEGTEDRF